MRNLQGRNAAEYVAHIIFSTLRYLLKRANRVSYCGAGTLALQPPHILNIQEHRSALHDQRWRPPEWARTSVAARRARALLSVKSSSHHRLALRLLWCRRVTARGTTNDRVVEAA